MKTVLFCLLLSLASVPALAQQLALIKQHLAAYNSHDAEKYASYFHKDISVYNYPDTPITSGKGALLETSRKTFREHKPSSEIVEAMELNDKVITLERSSFKANGGRQEVEIVKIYQFQNGVIRRMTFLH